VVHHAENADNAENERERQERAHLAIDNAFPLTPFGRKTTLYYGHQRERIASVSHPPFLLDDGQCRAFEVPNLRT
jgi:hypothetical protein